MEGAILYEIVSRPVGFGTGVRNTVGYIICTCKVLHVGTYI